MSRKNDRSKVRTHRKRTPRQRTGDYRIFIGAFPQGELAAALQSLREKYDPRTAVITPPHVTLAGTFWRTGPATPENEAVLISRLQNLPKHVPPFGLVLGGIRTFGRRVVYLGVESTEAVTAVRQQILHRTGKDKHRLYTPHLTLAMRLKPEAVRRMVAELKESEWHDGRFPTPITELRLMQRGPDDPAWHAIATFPLER
ncbi:MAG: 2'-5' RNA ligase family protein [Anaerolineae bacterium]